jgi:hypothetical protein
VGRVIPTDRDWQLDLEQKEEEGMKKTIGMLAVAVVGVGLLCGGAVTAFGADEFCAMGGTQIKAEVDKDKALEWGKDQRKAVVVDEADAWSVLALSESDKDIAILVKADGVFFGVAGKAGREVDSRAAEKVFGNDLRGLREAVKKGMGDLRKKDVVKIDGSDVQPLSDAAGLGVLEKKGRDWELSTVKCDGTELDASELK